MQQKKKSNNTRAVNDFYCRVASSFQSAAYEKNSPQHQFCSAGRRVDMVSGRCRKMSQVLVVEKTEVGKKKKKLNSISLFQTQKLRLSTQSCRRPGVVLFLVLLSCLRNFAPVHFANFRLSIFHGGDEVYVTCKKRRKKKWLKRREGKARGRGGGG